MKSIIEKFKVTEDTSFPSYFYFNDLIKDISNDSRVKVFQDGHSQLGKQLVAFAIGTGSKVIGVTSGAHADEPIGVLTQKYFIKGLLENPEFSELLKKYTFLCHPLVDPDGYDLNSTWFSNPLDFKNYFLNNYRNNNPSKDCEHGIPFQENQTARPEMIFVKKNLDLHKGRFDFYVTLHSSHILPGACFVFDRDHKDQDIRNSISNLCQTYQLPLMDYKAKGDDTMTYLGPGFIGAPNVSQMLEHYKNHPEILSQIKMTTYEYAQSYCGAKSAFISELPIWICEGLDDYRDSSMTMNEFKKITLENSKNYLNQLNKVYDELSQFSPSEENPWYSSLKTALKRGQTELEDEQSKTGTYEGFAQELEVKEIVAQPSELTSKALKYAIKSVEDNESAKLFQAEKMKQFNVSIAEYEKIMNLNQLSIKTQVEVQLGLIFSGINNL
jgi:hypothetical protein